MKNNYGWFVEPLNSYLPKKRKIVELKISGKYSNQEIADKLNLSINTIKFQYSQALKELRMTIRLSSFMLLLLGGL